MRRWPTRWSRSCPWRRATRAWARRVCAPRWPGATTGPTRRRPSTTGTSGSPTPSAAPPPTGSRPTASTACASAPTASCWSGGRPRWRRSWPTSACRCRSPTERTGGPMRLKSYAAGRWVEGTGTPMVLANAVTGEPVAEIDSTGLDFAGMLDHARRVGGPALRRLTFHQRALKLKELAAYLMERKEEFYEISKATGATRTDSWIDVVGGIGTLFAYASKGRRELPNRALVHKSVSAAG